MTVPITSILNSEGYMTIGEDWPMLVKAVFNDLQPKSVLDVGCGPCRSMGYFKMLGVPRVVGIDGSIGLLNNGQVHPHKESLVLLNLNGSPCVLGEKFDLVWSFEVAEHIDVVDHYVLTMTENAGRYIVMTAAPPHQGGTHHVNCQSSGYWIAKMKERGFNFRPDLSAKYRAMNWVRVGYFSVSGMVFERAIGAVDDGDRNLDIKFAGHYACYKDRNATFEALKAFRQFNPDAPVHLLSDHGDDFQAIADRFNCRYTFATDQAGNGITTTMDTQEKVMLWLNRIKATATMFPQADWIVILEDDIRTQGKIRFMPSAPMAGPCTMPYTDEAILYLKRRHPNLQINGWSGCGGTIIHRETFLKCLDNMFDLEAAIKLDNRLNGCSDAILTFLFLYNGYENALWMDQSEQARGVGLLDAAFDHQYKAHYGKPWDDARLTEE